MMDIKRITDQIIEAKENMIARAFTIQITSLLIKNGIVPIMTEHREKDLESITDKNRYKIVYKFGVTFDELDTSKHDAKVKADAINDFQEWLKSQIVGIDNNTKEILVVVGDRWELAVDRFKEVNK